MRLYLAGPLFTDAERDFNARVAAALESAGHRVFLPQRDVPEDGGPGRTQRLFDACRSGLIGAEVVVAMCDGPLVDDGTAWEVGFACARGMTVYALRTDRRRVAADEAMNLMIQESVARVCGSLDELLAAIG